MSVGDTMVQGHVMQQCLFIHISGMFCPQFLSLLPCPPLK